MNVHQSTDVDLTLAAALSGPAFVPLGDVAHGAHVLESQSTLGLTGTAGPLTVQVVLAPTGTVAGTPPAEPLAMGLVGLPGPLPGTLLTLAPVTALPAGVLGLVVTEGLPAGSRLVGRLVSVYGAI